MRIQNTGRLFIEEAVLSLSLAYQHPWLVTLRLLLAMTEASAILVTDFALSMRVCLTVASVYARLCLFLLYFVLLG